MLSVYTLRKNVNTMYYQKKALSEDEIQDKDDFICYYLVI